ncbi:DNA endonuclease ctp1 [Wickerhamiella sorbophila]|uniref:DNA endonuclease ctp1 n=1 Tax=Wickerhamiella sorbophila TaxID=45607 RepID=A0A2T0FGT7_9ASCO|nr:DNA endonuclease ctp1 [Wickerhamiella sorbophila]PRT54159.1 DNA endonuclease ctp1 [Wickerhamiella sorbophila]
MNQLDEAVRLIAQAKKELCEADPEHLRKRIRQLESENHALRQTVKILSDKRSQDRERVRQWETAFSQSESAKKHQKTTQLPSDSLTQLASEPQAEQDDPKLPDLPPSSQPIVTASLPLNSDDVLSDEPLDDSILESSPTEDDPLKHIIAREWHPSDFVVNPNYGKAYTEVVRGNQRQCLHGNDCEDCAKFYALLGNGGNALIQMASRHREDWRRQETPPGFWRSEFVDTQHQAQEKSDLATKRAVEANRRLEEALVNGQYLFRDRALREMVNGLRKKKIC